MQSVFLFAVAVGLLASQSTIARAEEVAGSDAKPVDELARFTRDVQPLLQKLCSGCHGAKDPKGHLQISMLDHELANGEDAEAWQDVLDRVNLGEMPPPKAKQPTKAQRQVLVRWLTEGLREAAEAKQHSRGRVVMRRLTRYEYQNTMRDLLGVDLN